MNTLTLNINNWIKGKTKQILETDQYIYSLLLRSSPAMIFQYSLFWTLRKILRKGKKICIHFSRFWEMLCLLDPSWNTFFTCRGLSVVPCFIAAHQSIFLVPSSFILTRSSLVPNSIDLCGSILKRQVLWEPKCRSPHYKTKHLTTKPIYSKQTTDYKLQWSSITSPLSHAKLGQTPLTHYCELWQYWFPNCNECSRNNYLYACKTRIGYQILEMSKGHHPCCVLEATVKLEWAGGSVVRGDITATIPQGLLWKTDNIANVWMSI